MGSPGVQQKLNFLSSALLSIGLKDVCVPSLLLLFNVVSIKSARLQQVGAQGSVWWETRPQESESPITGVKASQRRDHLSVFPATRLSQHGLCDGTVLHSRKLFGDIENSCT
ncbi:hypothetical protein DNTS_002245 [Danionella cerebrum]|uniref:Uncharacterized protein n=1 Tax=Danionella cerebrum TaxID=2873325 RepID=A0A553P0T7_9TELE|nr:hypothetical protein DNTS_002245 [Danionella translucida]